MAHCGDLDLAMDNLGKRKSCSECRRKKRKCDGQTPCSRCLRAEVQCTYSKRKAYQLQRRDDSSGLTGVQSTDLLRHSSSRALLPSGTLPLKRFRLRASPATGLVGMQENAFLSDFFGCVGFLPLTTRSHVRGTMVKLMASSTAQHQPGAPDDFAEQRQFSAVFTEDGITTRNQFSTGSSACTFWCAVGVGALVKGNPVESVADYSRLARGALDAYTGPVDAEVAKAWAILGYFYGFMGDTVQFLEYLKLSDSFLISSIEQGSTHMLPAGFAEIVQYRETVMVYSGGVDTADVDSLAAQRQHSPQIKTAASEQEIFPYVAQSLAAFDRRVMVMARNKRATRRHSSDGEACAVDLGGANLHGNAPRAEEVSEAMVDGFKAGLIDFEHLQDAADRPNIRAGIGGLLINMILAFQKAAKGEAGLALGKLRHCVEVFERYPGVCRCMRQWSHVADGVLAALAAIDDPRARGLYNRLLEVYTPSRPPASLPPPPSEESQRASGFCDHVHSRLTEGIIATRAASAFSPPPDGTSNVTDLQRTACTEENLQVVDEECDRGIVSAGVAPAYMVGWTGLNQESAPQMSPPVAPISYGSHIHCEPARGGEKRFSRAAEGCDRGVFSDWAAPVPGMSLTSPESRGADGVRENPEDDAAAAADWLDATYSMLGVTRR